MDELVKKRGLQSGFRVGFLGCCAHWTTEFLTNNIWIAIVAGFIVVIILSVVYFLKLNEFKR